MGKQTNRPTAPVGSLGFIPSARLCDGLCLVVNGSTAVTV